MSDDPRLGLQFANILGRPPISPEQASAAGHDSHVLNAGGLTQETPGEAAGTGY